MNMYTRKETAEVKLPNQLMMTTAEIQPLYTGGDLIFLKKWNAKLYNHAFLQYILSEEDLDRDEVNKRKRNSIRIGTFVNNREYRDDAIICGLYYVNFYIEDFLNYGHTVYLPCDFKYRYSISTIDTSNPIEFTRWVNKCFHEIDPELSLLICGDIEANPGPVQSKPFVSRECTITKGVRTEGIMDWFNLPDLFKSMNENFATFVENLPNREEISCYATGIFQKVASLQEQIRDSTSSFLDFGNVIATGFKKAIISSFAMICFAILRNTSCCKSVLDTIGKFFLDFFGLSSILHRVKSLLGPSNVVSTEAVFEDYSQFMDSSKFSMLGASVFAILFSGLFGKIPKTTDLKDVFNMAFTYNRGLDSMNGLFNKAFNMWQAIAEKLLYAKIGTDLPLSEYDATLKVNTFLSNVGRVLSNDFHSLDFEEQKQYRTEVVQLHQESINILNCVSKLPLSRQANIRQTINILTQKAQHVCNQPLKGEMRVPMFVSLLAGPSGAGKTTLLTIAQAIGARCISDTMGIPVSQENVCSLNLSADHCDGYQNQQIMLFNDTFITKNSEMKPSPELDFFMRSIDPAPFALKMAELNDKGKFFTSKFGVVTTNVPDVCAYAEKSMSYAEAISRRFPFCYKVYVKPQYRKYLTPKQVTEYTQKQKLDQHSVDSNRAKYVVDESTIEARVGRKIDSSRFLDTYTDEEFEKMDKVLLVDSEGKPQGINTDIYIFMKYGLSPFQDVGHFIEFPEWASLLASTFIAHLKTGEFTLRNNSTFFEQSLQDMLKGTVVKTQGIVDFIKEWLPYRRQDEVYFDVDENMSVPQLAICEEMSQREQDLCTLINNYDVYQVIVDLEAGDFNSHPMLRDANTTIGRWYNIYGAEFFEEAAKKMRWQQQEFQRQIVRQQYLCMPLLKRFETAYEHAKKEPWFAGLVSVSKLLGVIGAVFAFQKIVNFTMDKVVDKFNPKVAQVRDQCKTKDTASMTWGEWLANKCGMTKVKLTDINNVELSTGDIIDLWNLYGIYVETEAASGCKNERKRLLRMRVPTHVAQLVATKIKDVQVKEDYIEFPEHMVSAVAVQTQAIMNQLTEQTFDHIIPASQWFMSVDNKPIGNVIWLDGEHILMPHHYILKFESLRNALKVNDETIVTFERALTFQELKMNGGVNDIKIIETKLGFMKNYRRIVTPLNVRDESNKAPKDASIVHIKATQKSGTTCRKIVNKFMSRSDMARLSAKICVGKMFTWRKREGILCDRSTELTDIKAINLTSLTAGDLIEEQPHVDSTGKEGVIQLLLRSRYDYTIASQAGDCGSILWISDNQLPKGMCGMHVSASDTAGKGCSVPLTYEDIIETMEQFKKVNTHMTSIEVEPLTSEELYSPLKLVPSHPYEILGKIKDPDWQLFQPTKSSWVLSPLGEKLEELKDSYYLERRQEVNIDQKLTQACLRPFIKDNTGEYYIDGGQLKSKVSGAPLQEQEFVKFTDEGCTIVDPVIRGLEKAKRPLYYFDPKTLKRITNLLVQQLSIGGRNGYADINAYISSITEYTLTDEDVLYQAKKELCLKNIDEMFKRPKFERVLAKYFANTQQEVMIHYLEDIGVFAEDEISLVYRSLFWILDEEAPFGFECAKRNLESCLSLFVSRQMDYERPITSKVKKVFSIRTAIKGIDGNPTCKSMNAKSSPGYGGFHRGKLPYMCRKFPGGKKCWFGEDYELDLTQVDVTINGKVVCKKEQVVENYHDLIKDIEHILEVSKQEVPETVFVATLKDEKRSIEKVLAGKTRVFCASDMGTCIAFKTIAGPIISWLQQNMIDNGMCVGINSFSTDWEQLADKLSTFGGKSCVAGDFGAFDMSQSRQVLTAIASIFEGLARKAGITDDEQLSQIDNMLRSLIHKIIIVKGKGVVLLDQILPSGCPPTITIDCLFNFVIFMYIYAISFDTQEAPDHLFGVVSKDEVEVLRARLLKLNKFSDEWYNVYHTIMVSTIPRPKVSLTEFFEQVILAVYGDDHVVNIDPKIQPWFNQRTITNLFTYIGMEYTDERKTGDLPPDLRKLTDVTFLKRSFKPINTHGRRWIAPLDIDVVKEISLWRTGNQSIENAEALEENMKTALREMTLHGEQKYNQLMDFFDYSWRKLFPGITILFEDYDTLFVQVLHQESDLDF